MGFFPASGRGPDGTDGRCESPAVAPSVALVRGSLRGRSRHAGSGGVRSSRAAEGVRVSSSSPTSSEPTACRLPKLILRLAEARAACEPWRAMSLVLALLDALRAALRT